MQVKQPKGEDTIDHYRVTKQLKKFDSNCKNINDF